MENISEEVVVILKTSKLSSYKIAQDTGITGQTIQNYKDGKTKPSGANLIILSKYLGIDLKSDYKENEVRREVAEPEIKVIECLECINKQKVIDAQSETIASQKQQIMLLNELLEKYRSEAKKETETASGQKAG